MFSYRDHDQYEVDVVIEDAGGRLVGVKIKAAATYQGQVYFFAIRPIFYYSHFMTRPLRIELLSLQAVKRGNSQVA